jgi:hypothetical protein
MDSQRPDVKRRRRSPISAQGNALGYEPKIRSNSERVREDCEPHRMIREHLRALKIILRSMTREVALGWDSRTPSALGNRTLLLIPNVALVVFELVFFQERAELILKRSPSMVLLLIHDITADLVNMRLTNRESTITTLPMKL